MMISSISEHEVHDDICDDKRIKTTNAVLSNVDSYINWQHDEAIQPGISKNDKTHFFLLLNNFVRLDSIYIYFGPELFYLENY